MNDIQYLKYHLDAIKTVRILKEQGRTSEEVCKDFGITGDWSDALMFMVSYKCRYG